MAIPNGWTEVSVDGDPKRYYEATIGEYVAKDKKTVIRVIAKTDTSGNFDLYEVGPGASFPGGISGPYGDPKYTYNQSDNKVYTGVLPINTLNQITSAVKKRSYEINQAVGTDSEKEAIKNSKGYKSLSQTQPDPTDNQPGISPTDSSLQSGSGSPPPLSPNPATFATTTKSFQKETGETYNGSYLIYPKNISDYQDRITIIQRQYVSPDVLTNNNFDVSKVDNFGKERFYDDTLVKNLGTVTLPMPNDISETNVTAWGEDSLSSLAALVGGTALGVAGGISNFDTQQIQTAIESAKDKIFGGPGGETIKQLLSLNAAAQISQKFGININPEAFRSRITGTAINPNLELLFQGPKLRSFGFQFKMTPRSIDEAKNIRNILKFFKKGMAPKRSLTNQTNSYFLGAPNVFDIYFKSKKEKDSPYQELVSIGKIKTCALQQCVINYTPDGFYAAFQDNNVGSQPIAVTMQLAFTELTPIYNEYFDLTNEDSVGFDESTLKTYKK